jgi:hypothetical protein
MYWMAGWPWIRPGIYSFGEKELKTFASPFLSKRNSAAHASWAKVPL